MIYRVYIQETFCGTEYIEASSEAEAKEIVNRYLETCEVDLPHSDGYEVVELSESTERNEATLTKEDVEFLEKGQ